MLTKTMTILLGIIESQPVNAYELNKWLSKMQVRDWYPIAVSTVYTALKSAEKKGYISGSVEKAGNMPEKTVYSLTESGRAALLETLRHDLSEFEYDITPFHIGMFFADALGREETVSLLESRLSLLRKYRQGLHEQLEKMAAAPEIPRLVLLNTKQNLYIAEAQVKGAEEILTALTA